MKKNREDGAGHGRYAFIKWQHELDRKDKKYNPNKLARHKNILGWVSIVAPRTISLYEFDGENKKSPYEQTINFLLEIRAEMGRKKCFIDFSETKRISAAAIVVVYAAIEMARENGEAKTGVIWSKVSSSVNDILRSQGIYRLARYGDSTAVIHGARTMPVVSSWGNERMEEILDFIQDRIYSNMSADTEYIYGSAVSETIHNVQLHAYPDRNAEPEKKRWWLMCSAVGKKLHLAIYDCGVGIPRTVVKRPWFLASMETSQPQEYEALKLQFPDLERSGYHAYIPTLIPDEKLIFLSMQGDVSGTKKDKHGQGSKSIKALVSETIDGLLWVFSNKGLYTFDDDEQSTITERLPKKFPGTLVQWNIDLP